MQKKLPEDSIFKKKGFFAALYACVGVVLVLAAVVSYNNINSISSQPQTSEMPVNEANAGFTKPNPEINATAPIMSPADTAAEQAAAEEQAARNALSQPTDIKKGTVLPPNAPGVPTTTTMPSPSDKPNAAVSPAPKPSIVPERADSGENGASDPEFQSFAEGDKMDWPVPPLEGGIVLDYSMEHTAYNPTYQDYRVNDNICITAGEGTPVKAASAGIVVKVEKTHETGNTVTIDNGNGWTTTYGQLQDHIVVKEGDLVKKDQTIGGVASPTNASILLGSHVNFKVQKDNAPVDPKTVLADLN
jgi:murein DD-endopeptidase MepM/ murein hydrolase activator NlpD